MHIQYMQAPAHVAGSHAAELEVALAPVCEGMNVRVSRNFFLVLEQWSCEALA